MLERLSIVGLVLLALLVVGGCADGAAGASGADTPPASPAAAAIIVPEAADGQVRAGTIIEVIYPGGELRGISHVLQRRDGSMWTDTYQLAVSDPDQPYDPALIKKAWAPVGEEFAAEGIGFRGSGGGQFTVVPPPAEAGMYRVCGVQPDRLCSAAFDVVAQDGP